MARVYETTVVLLLLTLLVLGIVWVASAMVSGDAASRQSLYGGCCCSARGSPGSGRAGLGPGAEGMPGATGLTLLPPQTSGSTTCPTSTPASRSSACCFCFVSWGVFPGGPSCSGCGSLGLLPANGAGIWGGHSAGLSPQPCPGPLRGAGRGESWGTPCSASCTAAVCTPFGLSTMFAVTGKLLVKPRVRCPPPGPAAPAWGLYRPQGCLLCHPGEGVPFTPHRLLTGSSPTPAPGRPG